MARAHDRTAHATSRNRRSEVARYDRAGKWWLETADGTRTSLRSIAAAVETAVALEADGGTIHLGRTGGTMFDAKVRRARAERRA